ncbi:hypothetical protein EZY14_001300 [Kordia sp. TARA_039_SRF]|nr:hypothetical protein EZY14_001300 [Kordia sp. TARA_039_SRF]
MKIRIITFLFVFIPIALFSQINSLAINKVKYCESLIDSFNKEMDMTLKDEAGSFWIEKNLLFFKNKHGEVFRFPVDRIHVNLKKEYTYLEIQIDGNESDVYWSSKKTTMPQFTSRAAIYYKPKKFLSKPQMESHVQMLNEIITCLQEKFTKEDFRLGINYIDSLKIVKGIEVSKIKSNQKPKKDTYTDVNIFSSNSSKSKRTLTASEKAKIKRFQDSLKRETDKAWAGAKKAKKCPKCAGYGHVYTSKKVNNTYVEYSEDDIYLYKKTKKTTDNYYRKIKCSQCKGTGKTRK